MKDQINIDGSMGEGGGQILRSSLAMSLLTNRPFVMSNIRANRDNPGLRPQHLSAIKAACAISESQTQGAMLDSRNLEFNPGTTRSGKYTFQVPTAGAMTLVFQTVALPLALTGQPSQLEFLGGTHVAWAPIYEYVRDIWVALLGSLGWSIELEIHRAGYYPQGKGHFTVRLSPFSKVQPLQIVDRPQLQNIHAISILSKLPKHIAEREFSTLETQIRRFGLPCHLTNEIHEYEACQPGNALFVKLDFGILSSGFSSLGEKNRSAETVAGELVGDLRSFWEGRGCVDHYLADQLLLPLIFATGTSCYRVQEISQHLLTNAAVISKFHKVKIDIFGKEGEPGVVTIEP